MAENLETIDKLKEENKNPPHVESCPPLTPRGRNSKANLTLLPPSTLCEP